MSAARDQLQWPAELVWARPALTRAADGGRARTDGPRDMLDASRARVPLTDLRDPEWYVLESDQAHVAADVGVGARSGADHLLDMDPL